MATIKLNDVTKDDPKPEAPKKVISKVIKGNVVVRKPSLLSKFKQTFFADDIQNVKSYAVKDVIIPGIKHLFLDSLSMLILGEKYYSSGTKRSTGTSYSYNTVYKSKLERERKVEREKPGAYNYNEIIFETKGDADDAMETLLDLIDVYGDASIADLYRIVGADFTPADYNFGWNDLSRAEIRRTHGGYLLELPRPRPID